MLNLVSLIHDILNELLKKLSLVKTMLPGLKLIINYNRIVGITFFGLTYHGEKLNNRMIWLLRLWNVIVIIIIAIFNIIPIKF